MDKSPSPKKPPGGPGPEGRSERRHPGGSLIPPIFQTATFTFESAAELDALHGDESKAAFFYSRFGNPTNAAAEARLARLEGAGASLLYASGMGAVSSVLLSLLAPGARLVMPPECYRHSLDLVDGLLTRYGVAAERTAENTAASLEALAEGPVRALFTEAPSNPTFRLPDLERMAEWAHARRACFVVDATIASPALLRPLAHGADLVLHSATKFLGGHNDLIAGAVSGPRPLLDALREQQTLLGCILGPQEAFLLDRGMKTLEVRMERASATALGLAEFAAGHEKIRRVHYLGLPSHPDHGRARKMMKAFGAMLSFEMAGGAPAADRLVDALRVAVLAPGFGGTESQAEHHARMAYADIGLEGAHKRGVPPGLVRYSVGLEDFDVLREDLSEALKKV